MPPVPQRYKEYFASRGWKPFPFQQEVWQTMISGKSGLLHAPTGMGKTLAVWLGAIAFHVDQPSQINDALTILWLTPLRALANDTLTALSEPLADLAPGLEVGLRTGDTSSYTKKKQEKKLPNALVTTPESLTLLLTRKDAKKKFGSLRIVIVDEWHELLGTKRGVQTELALARLRKFAPQLLVWGLSATMANLDEAMLHLLGRDEAGIPNRGALIQGEIGKEIRIDSLIPDKMERFPWAGHLGLKMVSQVVAELKNAGTALVFTNTRSQCELWHQALTDARPEWNVGLHHGSIAKEERDVIEDGLKQGKFKVVVCTSSLDLGVDFSPVDRVLQIGSPKGVARLMQRAGRSGHGPGRISRLTCVPVSALELVEAAAARDAIQAKRVEPRVPYHCPFDVLAQHMVSMALSEGFNESALLNEVRTAASYADLTDDEWNWLLDFLTSGGKTLSAYPEYHKLVYKSERYHVNDTTIAKRHRMAIGSIVSDAAIRVKYQRGPTLGSVEESFISRLRPGESFLFAGKSLELIKVDNLTAYVRKAPMAGAVPVWYGGRMPLSSQLAESVRSRLDAAAQGSFEGPEMEAVRPLLDIQAQWSAIPRQGQILLESIKSREGFHTYIYPFAGRLVHEGLAALLAWRLSQREPLSFTWSVNDYGIELLAPTEPPLSDGIDAGLFEPAGLTEDIIASLNAAELAKSRFREIAKIAGLVFEGYPGKSKTARQVQATSSLIFAVFSKYDPENPLLQQSHLEVFERQLERTRLFTTLRVISSAELVIKNPQKITPLAFPLLVDRLREKLSSEKLHSRIQRMLQNLEKHAA
jgi:ATP-dependent Lhr-like helicase